MPGETETILGIESDDTTQSYKNKAQGREQNPFLDYLRKENRPEPGATITPEQVKENFEVKDIKPPQKPSARVAEKVTQDKPKEKPKTPAEVARSGPAGDMLLQAPAGVRDAAQELIDGASSLIEWGSGNEIEFEGGTAFTLPEVDQPRTVAGGLARGVTQFLTGFLPALKMMQGVKAAGKAANIGKALTAGSIADFSVFDPHAERLSNFLKEFPYLNNPVTQFLAADPKDSELEGRMKNVLEGLGLEAVTAGAFMSGLKTFRGIKKMRAAKMGEAAERAIKSGKEAPAEDLFGARKGAAFSEAEFKKKTVREAKQAERTKKVTKSVKDVTEEETENFLNIQVSDEVSKKAANINLAKIETEDDIKKVLEKTAKTFSKDIDKSRRGVRSNAVTEEIADSMGLELGDLLAREQGEAFNAETILAARKILLSSAENIQRLAGKLQTAQATDADRLLFRKALSIHSAVQKQVSGLTAEAGRALQQFNIKAKTGAEQAKAIQNILDGSGGRSTTQELAKAISETSDPKKLQRFINKASRAGTADMVFEAWVNSLLSGPRTHMVNMTSNSINAFIQLPEKALASVYGKVFQSKDGAQIGEAFAQAHGMVEGVKDGWRMAKHAFKTEGLSDPLTKLQLADRRAITAENISHSFLGRNLIDPALKTLGAKTLRQGGVAARFADGMGAAIRFPGFRMLNSEDAFFKGVNQRMQLHADAFRQATREGLSGKDLSARVVELVENPTEAMRLNAQEAAAINTFTNPNPTAQAFQKFVRKVPGLRYITPFVNTPTNIVKFGLDRTPFAFMSGQIRADIMAGGLKRDLALSRITLGTGAMLWAWDKAQQGQITGGAPLDPDLKKTWMNDNQEYSLVFNNADGTKTFVSYNRLEPLGMLLGTAADYSNIMHDLDDKDAAEVIAASTVALTKNVTSKTWLKGVSDFVEAFNDPERRLDRFVKNMGAGFVPNVLNQTNQSFVDPVLRETRGFKEGGFAARSLASYMDEVKSRIPGYSQTLPVRRNLWGEKIEPRANHTEGGWKVYNLLSPAYIKTVEGDKVNEILVENEIAVEMPRRKVAYPGLFEAVELKPEEYSKYVELAGRPAKRDLDKLVASGRLEGATKVQIERVFKNIISAHRSRAKKQILDFFPELEQRVEDQRRASILAATTERAEGV